MLGQLDSHMKKNEITPMSLHIQKLKYQITEWVKNLEENVSVNLHDFRSDMTLDITPKA